MANQYSTIPVPSGNGPGAALDISTYGGLKTVIVGLGTANTDIQTTIEVSLDAAASRWAPIASFQGSGQWSGQLAAWWIRANVSNRKFGMVDPQLGGDDGGASFVNLPAPADDGVGASVNISGFSGALKTAQVGGPYRGNTLVEFSEDGNVWGETFSFARPAVETQLIVAQYARTRRVGVPRISPGLPIVSLGITNPPGSGGGGGGGATLVTERYTASGGESEFVVILTATQPTPNYGVIPALVNMAYLVAVSCPVSEAERTELQFSVVCSAPLTAGDIIDFFIVEP